MALRTLHPFRSVRGKLFFHYVAILAPFVLLGLLWAGDATMNERDHLISRIEARTNRVIAPLAALVRDEAAVLETVGEIPAIQEATPVQVSAILSAMLAHHPLINEFAVVDHRGTSIALAPPEGDEEEFRADGELIQSVLKAGQPELGRARIARVGRAAGQPVIPLAVVLRDRAGRVTGVLSAELILADIQRLFTLDIDTDGGYSYVVDRAGQVIAHPREAYARSLRDFASVPAVQDLLGGEEGTGEFMDPIEGISLIAVYKKVSPAGLGVVSGYPSSRLSETMARSGFGILVVFGITLTFAVATAYVVGNHMADRLVRLAEVATAVGAGQTERRSDLISQDEMGMIARGVNSLAERYGQELAKLESLSRSLSLACEDVGSALAGALNAEEAVRLAMISAARMVGAGAAMGLLSEPADTLRVVKSFGPIPPRILGQLWPLDDQPSLLGRAAKQCDWQQVQDVLSPGVPPDPVVLLGREAGFRSALVVPLASYGRCLGALVLFDVQGPRAYRNAEVSRVRAIASQAAIAIENARLQEQIKTANQQLIQSGLRLRTIIETMPAGVLVAVAPGGQITLANTAGEELLGRKSEPEADLHEQAQLYHLYHPEGSLFRGEELPLYRSIVMGQNDTKEILVKRPDGTAITVLFSSSPMRNEEGKIAGAVGVFRDISEMKNLDRLKDEFISITSHELKSPLTIVRGYAQLLLQRLGQAPEREEELKWLQAINDQSNRLTDLVERLLDVSRIQTGRLELAREPVDLIALVRRVAEQEQVTTTLHQIRVHTDLRELTANCDKARIEQVLINLLDNAIKYSPKGGGIEVGVHRVDNEAQISVRDQGIGISKEDQRRIFHRFYRAQAGKERPSGLGLGLYISYQTITLHGGRMWVESEPGEGSTFYFTLPLNHDQP